MSKSNEKCNRVICNGPFLIRDLMWATVSLLQSVLRGEILEEIKSTLPIKIVKVFQKNTMKTLVRLVADMKKKEGLENLYRDGDVVCEVWLCH